MTTRLRPEADRAGEHGSRGQTGSTLSSRRRTVWVVLAVVAIVATALIIAVVRSDDGAQTSTTPSTVPSTVPSSSAPTPTSTPANVDTSTAVWPQAASATRYTDPVAAATGFAVDFLGFRDPVVGDLMAGDLRSGEVEIRPTPTGPVTTVLVRQLGSDDSWWVLGAATDNIRLATPAALDEIASPVHLTGTSTSFEANVGVLIYSDGLQAPLTRSFVMGGANGDFAPFDAMVEFAAPRASAGTVVLFTQSMEDGRMWEASVVRVRFAP
jgi:hypothetical protein